MTLKIADRVKEGTSTTGTGTWNLDGSVNGFQTFVDGIGSGDTCPYFAVNLTDPTEWETGIGTVTDATPDTLARSVRKSSNGTSLVNFTNTPTVACGWIADIATLMELLGAISATSTDTLTNKKITDDSNEVHAEAVFDRVRNDSGGMLARGTPVYASGYNSGLEVVLVDKADADDPAKMPAIGIIDTDISNNANGHIVTRGDVTGFNTSGFTVLDELYVSTTAGVLTATRPTAAATEVQLVAIVLRSHTTLGIISVVGAGRSNDIPNTLGGFLLTGDITVGGSETFDGRDVSVDGDKLDGIASGAEVNPDVISQGDAEAGTSTTERTWTAERVEQAIAALASGTDNVARNNIMLNAFRIAINGGLSVLNMEDGIVDEFEDETGVDTGASTGEAYDSGDDFYINDLFSGSAFSPTLNNNFSNQLNRSLRVVLEASLITQSGDTCKITFEAASTEGLEIDLCYIGEKAASGDEWDMKTSPAPVKVTFSSSDGFSIDVAATIESDTIDFAIDSSTAYVIAFDMGSNLARDSTRSISSLAGAESYLKSDANEAHLADVTGYSANQDLNGINNIQVFSIPDIVLQSNAFTAVTPSDPTEARIVLFEEDVDAVTLNTDLKAYTSRDGTTFTQITLADEGDYDTGKRILVGSVDISGQPSGTSMKWKLTTHNAKRLKVHGVAEQWS